MPHRLTIFAIALVGLLTILITVSITVRDAHALNFDAFSSDYSTCIENESKIDIFYLGEPYNILTPLNFKHLKTTDFLLNGPLDKNTKHKYIANDFEVSGWLPTHLDETDVKKILSSDNIYKSKIDSFDLSQVVVQKFTSLFLIFASVLIFMLFFTCAILVFLDKITFQTVFQNCFRPDKSISWERIKIEIRRFSRFVLKVFIIIICYIVFNAILLTLSHEYIVPIPIVVKIFSAFNIDRVAWEENIEIGVFGDIGAEYEQWSKAKGFSPETGRFWQEFLWNYWYILIALLLYFAFTFYFSVFKLSLGIFMRYKKRTIRRGLFYHSVDLHKLNKKTLDTNQLVHGENNTENESINYKPNTLSDINFC
jgi:hypothetical protein